MPRLSLSLRLSLGTAFVGLVILTALALGLSAYFLAGTALKNSLRTRLHDVVSLGALDVDVEKHRRLQGPADEQTPQYRDVKAALQRVRDASTDIRFVYTLRQRPDGQIVFVVDAENAGPDMSHIGDVYETPTAVMVEAFKAPHRVHVEQAFTQDQWGIWLSSFAPILDRDGRLEAVLAVDISAKTFAEYRRQSLSWMLGLCGLVSLLSIGAGVVFSHHLSRPLSGLAEDMARVGDFRLDSVDAPRSHIREVAFMQAAVENMKRGLRSFRKFVPADLVAALIRLHKEASVGAEERDLTVFFSDIRDFTAIAESMSPKVLAGRLGVYLEGMAGTIQRHGGTVDKFIGDAVMAFWGAPAACQDHAVRACLAALDCQTFLDGLNARWQAEGAPAFVTRIGLDTGPVIVGNMGYEDRLSYTAIGDHVNLAQRLEGLGKHYGTRILISEAVYLGARDQVEARRLDSVAVKGKQQAVAIYELLAARGRLDADRAAAVLLYDEGLALYLARRWGEARDRFAACAAGWPGGDGPSEVLAERCRAFEDAPPPGDWRGVHAMKEK